MLQKMRHLWYLWAETNMYFSFCFFSLFRFLLPYSWRRSYTKWVGHVCMSIFLWVCRIRLYGDYSDCFLDENCVYVSNHFYSSDIYATLYLTSGKMLYMAKKEIKEMPILGWSLVAHGSPLFVDRQGGRGSGLLKIVKQINQSNSPIWVFAEGTRSKTGKLGKFKSGASVLARLSKRKICPVEIRYQFDRPYSTWPIRPLFCSIVLNKGSIIDPKDYEDIKELTQAVEKEIENLQKK